MMEFYFLSSNVFILLVSCYIPHLSCFVYRVLLFFEVSITLQKETDLDNFGLKYYDDGHGWQLSHAVFL